MSESKAKVEDLVKVALKEALEKRKIVEKMGDAPDPMKFAIPDHLKPVPIAKVDPEVPKTKAILKDKQTYLSIVLGAKEVKQDFGVTCFDRTDWHETVESFIPEVDHSYYIDTTLASNILMAWELGEKVLCYGPTGAGKSSLVEQLCARTGRPFIRINCTGDMDSSMIFGQLTAKDGSTVWLDGPATEAVRYGAVFAWDEWDVTPPEISMGLQWLLEDKGKLFLKDMPGTSKDKLIEPHPQFRIVAIGNTQGQGDETGAHSGTNVQNSATLDRFSTSVFVDYLPLEIEEEMILKKCGKIITKAATKELVKLANLIRQGYKSGQFTLTMSPRTLLGICRKLDMGLSLRESFNLVYLNKLNDTQKKVADELFTKIYGAST